MAQVNTTPAFIRVLYSILEDESNHNCITWSKGSDSIVITQPTTFALNVLPLHFKHNKFASFVRQLNKHNFCRVKRIPDTLTEGAELVRDSLSLLSIDLLFFSLSIGLRVSTSHVSKREKGSFREDCEATFHVDCC